MKKILVIGLGALAPIAGFVLIQNARAHGPMMGRGSWWPYMGREFESSGEQIYYTGISLLLDKENFCGL